MAKWRFEIPAVVPSANKILRLHWASRNRLIKSWRTTINLVSGVAGIPEANGRRTVHIVSHRKRLLDPDNLYLGSGKLILDALVRLRLLIDDSARWCNMTSTQVKSKKEEKTVVEVEEKS